MKKVETAHGCLRRKPADLSLEYFFRHLLHTMDSISRRRFFIHSAHQTIGVSAGLAAWEYGPWMDRLAMAEESPRPLRLCLVSGSFEYKSDESLSLLQAYLEKLHFLKRSDIRNHGFPGFSGNRGPFEDPRRTSEHGIIALDPRVSRRILMLDTRSFQKVQWRRTTW